MYLYPLNSTAVDVAHESYEVPDLRNKALIFNPEPIAFHRDDFPMSMNRHFRLIEWTNRKSCG
ncbi:uncharacterized protein CYBJADRAFT_169585 [Cyberlindnera jadinii NRRL Y-1542]|uniref:Uncharacterized protein n=1 Tax=Cyberlindnera jadinii (strain ATCC 18201 / CBS 1600 / BCRC 20928 / JCM 3617 / NBRC 0987 / NRRL Y-1542) TaxID=983966 RepID=A0A1E4RV68_CYBJN|nr:hypothetical protein CYBJADRAFT_169585 [Cyberlindnera jadinii NRRL Y-1542]ODV71164.1 hypothetical protein CYBJADRAFT_169585 [Cyberlindnera jadinii NRRL Y-1542]